MTDIVETDDEYIVKMELAGVKREEIAIDIDNNYLVVQGIRCESGPGEVKAFHRMEIHYGKFQRVFLLPSGVRKSGIIAELKDGFLYIAIKKIAQASRKKSIKVDKNDTN